jgi:hypothetical protein
MTKQTLNEKIMKNSDSLKLRKFTLILLGVIVAALTLQSCNQDNDAAEMTTEQEVELVENTVLAEDIVDEDVEIVNAADVMEFQMETALRTDEEVCFTRSWNAESLTLTIDFGEGCVGPYGKLRSGKIIVKYSERGDFYKADRSITFENYFVNNNQIIGEIFIEKHNLNEEGFYENNYRAAFSILFSGGQTFTIRGERKREWIDGVRDGDRTNNVFRLSGAFTGRSTRGVNWSHEIIEPIIADFNCKNSGFFLFSAGIKEVTFSNNRRTRTRVVDYGEGTCDNTFTITINDEVRTITAQ